MVRPVAIRHGLAAGHRQPFRRGLIRKCARLHRGIGERLHRQGQHQQQQQEESVESDAHADSLIKKRKPAKSRGPRAPHGSFGHGRRLRGS